MKSRYQTPMALSWFMKRPGFRWFMVREITSFFILAYLVYLLWWLHQFGDSAEAYAALIESSRKPAWIIFHGVAFLAAMFHAITWHNLTPKVNPVYLGEERVADSLVAIGMGYGPWIVISAVVIWGALH